MTGYSQELDHETVEQQITEAQHVLAGPWVGEFGWELFCYQGYLRNLHKNNSHLKSFTIISRTGRGILYEDFCDTYIEWDCPGKALTGALCMDWSVENIHEKIMQELNLDQCLWIPTQQFIINYHASGPEYDKYMKIFKQRQIFKDYGVHQEKLQYDVVIHARATNKRQTGNQNWPIEKWNELGETLHSRNLKVASIGIDEEAYLVPHSDNYMNQPLEVTANILKSSKCIIGTSSGPMHFATLCKCPQILISECVESGGKDNERRYKEDWNPFQTPVILVKYPNSQTDNGWNPPVNTVIETLELSNFLI